MVIERGVVTVALVEVDMTDGQLRIIHATDIHIIAANRLHRIGIDAVDMDLVAIEVAVHVVVEITDDVHALLLATGGVGFTAIEAHLFAAVCAINDAVFKLVLRHDAGTLQDAGHTGGVIVGTWSRTSTIHSLVGERVEMATAHHISVGIKRATLDADDIGGRIAASRPGAGIEILLFHFQSKHPHTVRNPIGSRVCILGVPQTLTIVLQMLYGSLQ